MTHSKGVLHIKSPKDYKNINLLSNRVINGLSKHTDLFANPLPSVEELTIANASLKAATTAAHSGNHVDIIARNDYAEKLHAQLQQEVIYVNNIAQGNKEIILSSGFDIRKEATKHPIPGQVVIRKIKFGSTEHSAKISIESLSDAKYYKIEKSKTPTDETSWQAAADNLTFYKLEVTGLTRAEEIWFRVAGGNSHGWGEWSEPVSFISK